MYAAEEAAFAGTDLEACVPLDDLVGLARLVTTGRWWPGPAVEVRPARRDAGSSSTRCRGGESIIRIAAEQSTRATLAHELAHALAGIEQGHGARFRAAYLDAVEVVTNAEFTDRRLGRHVEQLAVAFAAAGLAVGRRDWPAPGAGRAIAL